MEETMKRNDWILLACILLAAALLLAVWFFLGGHPGREVIVTIEGKEAMRLPLDQDDTVVLSGKDGGSNTLVIHDGKARITQADCPDKLCVRQQAISRSGQQLVCLPHRIVVSVSGSQEKDGTDGYDGVAY